MTVQTLTYIHELLKERDLRTSIALSAAKKALDAEDDENDGVICEQTHKAYMKALKENIAASSALKEFESKDW